MQFLSQFHHIVSLTTLNNSNENSTLAIEDFNTNIPSRSLIYTILIIFCLSIIILLTILGNILVLIALCIDFALRSPTHLLMGNLACADLLLGKSIFILKKSQMTVIHLHLLNETYCVCLKNMTSNNIDMSYC
jgi:hypothetical protein